VRLVPSGWHAAIGIAWRSGDPAFNAGRIENTTGTTISGTTTGNITGVDPNLGPLKDNGGPTFTHALVAGSPALDKGASFGAITDQRGLPRPFDDPAIPNAAAGGDGADIGAFEVQPAITSVVRITSITKNGNSVTIHGVGVPSAVHKIRATNDLLVPFNVNPIGTPTADANGNFQFTDNTGLTRRFYRAVYP